MEKALDDINKVLTRVHSILLGTQHDSALISLLPKHTDNTTNPGIVVHLIKSYARWWLRPDILLGPT